MFKVIQSHSRTGTTSLSGRVFCGQAAVDALIGGDWWKWQVTWQAPAPAGWLRCLADSLDWH